MYEAINYKLKQINILYQNGWLQAHDGSFQFYDEVEAYNKKQKPALSAKQRIHAESMIKKLYITNDLVMFYQTAEVFMKAMFKKKSNL